MKESCTPTYKIIEGATSVSVDDKAKGRIVVVGDGID